MSKYKFTGETIFYQGYTLHRIQAIISFGDVKAGDIGGWIEKEGNLSTINNSWVADEAMVFSEARVCGDALVRGHAKVHGHAWVSGNSIVEDYADVYNYAMVCNNARIRDNAEVFDDAHVHDNAEVCHIARVFGNAQISGDAVIMKMGDYMVFQNIWSSGRWFTWTRSNDMWKVGCFYGSGDELIKKAYRDSERSGKCYETIVKAVKVINQNIPYEEVYKI